MRNTPYDVLIFEEYEDRDGESRTKSYNVGVAFPNKSGEGFTMTIAPGIALSGRVSILPRKKKDDAGS